MAAAYLEPNVTLEGRNALVIGVELVQGSGVIRTARSDVVRVGGGERGDFRVGRRRKPNIFEELEEKCVGSHISLRQGEERWKRKYKLEVRAARGDCNTHFLHRRSL